MASSDPQGEVSASTRNSPGAPTESPDKRRTVRETGYVSDRVHTRQPPQRTEGPARDNPIAGPQTGTMRREPSAPALAGASGWHHELGSRPASTCPAQPPSKTGGDSPLDGGRHHGDGKADLSSERNRTGRGAAHQPGAIRQARRAHCGPQLRHRTKCQATAAAGCRKPGQRSTSTQPGHGRRCQATSNQARSAHRNAPTPPEVPEEAAEKHEGGDPEDSEERQQRRDKAKARPRDRTPRTGTTGTDRAAGAAAPRTGESVGRRPGLDRPERNKQGEPTPPGLDHPGRGGGRRPGLAGPEKNMKERPQPQERIERGKEARRPGQDRPGRNKQHESRPPGQIRTQHKGRHQGGAETQGRERGRGDAVQQR